MMKLHKTYLVVVAGECPVYLFVFLELLLYLFVGFPLCLLLISLVFGLTIAKTAHLPKNPVTGSGGRQGGWLVGLGGWVQEGRVRVLIRGRRGGKKSMDPKFLDWPSRGTPGSKWVTFMLPDADETDVNLLVGRRRWGPAGVWHSMDGWMDGCGYLLAINQPEISQRWAEQRCRPHRRLIPVFFTVNPQWSHQHWYESGCEISSLAMHMNEGRRSPFPFNPNAGFFLLLFLLNLFSSTHL